MPDFGQDLTAAQDDAKKVIAARIDGVSRSIIGPVPDGEIASWFVKSPAAAALLAAVETPEQRAILEAEATLTGETLPDLAQRIVTKSANYAGMAGRLAGLRRKYTAQIEAQSAITDIPGILASFDAELATI